MIPQVSSPDTVTSKEALDIFGSRFVFLCISWPYIRAPTVPRPMLGSAVGEAGESSSGDTA